MVIKKNKYLKSHIQTYSPTIFLLLLFFATEFDFLFLGKKGPFMLGPEAIVFLAAPLNRHFILCRLLIIITEILHSCKGSLLSGRN